MLKKLDVRIGRQFKDFVQIPITPKDKDTKKPALKKEQVFGTKFSYL